jgi:hypothetical protein
MMSYTILIGFLCVSQFTEDSRLFYTVDSALAWSWSLIPAVLFELDGFSSTVTSGWCLLLLQTILDPSFSQVEKKGLIRGNLSLSIFHTLGLQIKIMKMKIGSNALNMPTTRRLKLIPAMKKIMPIDHGTDGRHINTKLRITLNLQFGRHIYD